MAQKIIIDGRLLSNQHTGISRYSRMMIEALVNRYGSDNVTVIVAPDLEHKPLNHVQTKLRPFNLIDFFRFSFFVSKLDFDLFYSPFYSGVWFKQRGKKYVVTVHDLMYQKIPFFSKNSIVNCLGTAYYNLIVRRSLKHSTILSISQTTQDDVFAFTKQKSLRLRVGTYQLENHHTPSPLPHLADSEYFLYVGNLRMHKNIQFLITTFLKSKTPKKLVICGNYKSASLQYDPDRVLFLEYVDDPTLRALYANCTAFVFPSLYEGFGAPVLEALSFGANVYASTGGALREFSEEFVSFFDPKNEKELIHLLENEHPKPIDKEKLSAYLETFSWPTIQNEFANIIDEIATPKNIKPA